MFELCREGRGKKKMGAKKGGKESTKKESDVCTLRHTRELAFGAGIDTDRIDESEPANVPQSIPRINGSRSIFMKRARYATSKTEFNFAAGHIHTYIHIYKIQEYIVYITILYILLYILYHILHIYIYVT